MSRMETKLGDGLDHARFGLAHQRWLFWGLSDEKVDSHVGDQGRGPLSSQTLLKFEQQKARMDLALRLFVEIGWGQVLELHLT